MKRKRIAFLLALVLVLSLAACGGKPGASEGTNPLAATQPAPTEMPGEPVAYTSEFDGMAGKETAQFDLTADGTCRFSLPGNPMLTDVYTDTYTREGYTVTIRGLANVDASSQFKTPGLWNWIVDGGTAIIVDDTTGTFVPEGVSAGGDEEMPESQKNVAYATASPAQACDIYIPESVEKAPVIVLVHGGGFAFGDQAMSIIQPVIKAAMANVYAVVSVDYRKSGEAAFPAALADVKAAVRFVRANVEAYGFDTAFYTDENLAAIFAWMDGYMRG